MTVKIRPACDKCTPEVEATFVIDVGDGPFFVCGDCKDSMVRPIGNITKL